MDSHLLELIKQEYIRTKDKAEISLRLIFMGMEADEVITLINLWNLEQTQQQ